MSMQNAYSYSHYAPTENVREDDERHYPMATAASRAKTVRPGSAFRQNGATAMSSDSEGAQVPEVDLPALRERACQDDELVREVLLDFLSTSDELVGEMIGFANTGRFSEAAARAHRVRGALLALGANRAAEAATEVEHLATTFSTARVLTDLHASVLTGVLHTFRTRLDAARTEMFRFLGSSSQNSDGLSSQ
jgi:HPt (histidine-containing phosphotransfer) domain-containing protein